MNRLPIKSQPYVATVVEHEQLRVVWSVRMQDHGTAAALIDTRPVGRMLMLSLRSGAAQGRLNANAHATQPFHGLLFQLAGCQHVRDSRFECTLRAGDILLWQSGDSGCFDVTDGFHALQVLVPSSVFERYWPQLATRKDTFHFPGRHALVAMAQACIQSLWGRQGPEEPQELGSALMAVIDMVAKCRSAMAGTSRSRAPLFEEILAYIEQELDNPALVPAMIAQRHGCSIRSLHALFAKHEQTVVGFIRRRRLERCREQLDQRCRMGRIGDIALQWGFSDAAHFSKTFKAAYGLSPRQYRDWRLAQSSDGYAPGSALSGSQPTAAPGSALGCPGRTWSD